MEVGLRELDGVEDAALEDWSEVGEWLTERRGVSGDGSPCESRHINSSLSIDRRLFAFDSRSYFHSNCWYFSVSCLQTDTLTQNSTPRLRNSTLCIRFRPCAKCLHACFYRNRLFTLCTTLIQSYQCRTETPTFHGQIEC